MKCTHVLKAVMQRSPPALRSFTFLSHSCPSRAPKHPHSTTTPTKNNDNDRLSGDVLTPWSVEAKGPKGIDYNRVREAFKAQSISADMLQQLERFPNAPSLHHFFSRGIVFAHRDFDKALHKVEAYLLSSADGSSPSTTASPSPPPPPAYLYTGRGPSAFSMHVGHAVPFLLTRYLQDVLKLPAVIQITDDEKFLFRDVPFVGEEADKRVRSNIKDIIAFGFDPRRTFIFRNTHYMGHLYPTALAVQRAMTANAVRHTLGLQDKDSVGKFAFAATQAAPCFATAFPDVLPPPRRRGGPLSAFSSSSSSLPEPMTRDAVYHPPQCLIPCAVDQDPFFVLARHAASRIAVEIGDHRHTSAVSSSSSSTSCASPSVGVATRGQTKSRSCPPPATVYTTLLPALKGPGFKMSSSGLEKGILSLLDPPEVIERKLRKAFSGGSATLSEMTKAGGVDLDADVAFQYLRFFVRDDSVLDDIARKYTKGILNSGEIKKLCGETLEKEFMSVWRERRATVTESDVDLFCSIRSIL